MGTETEDFSGTVPAGNVISQSIEAGVLANYDSKVDLVISKGRKAPEATTMPNLIGMTREEAEAALRNAKLVAVQDANVVTTDFKAGTVCAQSVNAGTSIAQDTHVSYAIAVAPNSNDNLVVVPNLAGKSANDARDLLQKAGLGSDTASAYSDTVAKDNVISQSVAAGAKVTKGTVVTFTVSLGARPTGGVEVPNVTGQNANDAKSALEKAGLKADLVNHYSDTVAKDLVMSQSVAAGTRVAQVTVITIVVSLGQQQDGSVVVPDVVGMDVAAAQQTLKDAGLAPQEDDAYSDTIEQTALDKAMKAAGANYKVIKTLSTRACGNGYDYVFLCSDDSGNYEVEVHVENGTAKLVSATEATE